MKRYFYRDPLAAAWTAKCFGLTSYIGHLPDDIDAYGPSNWWHCPDDWRYRQEKLKQPAPLFYIHPDSLNLLEPQIGDILRLYFYSPEEDDKNGAVMTGFYAGAKEAITWFRDPKEGGIDKQVHVIDDHKWRIIQRNELAFMWPESEEA